MQLLWAGMQFERVVWRRRGPYTWCPFAAAPSPYRQQRLSLITSWVLPGKEVHAELRPEAPAVLQGR